MKFQKIHFLSLIVVLIFFSFVWDKPTTEPRSIEENNELIKFMVITEKQQFNLRKTKTYYSFSNGKILSTQYGIAGAPLHGNYYVYYSDHNLKETGKFYFGLKTGIWKKWNQRGEIISIEKYRMGKLKGLNEGKRKRS